MSEVCAAERAGILKFSPKALPLMKFNMTFMGTGTAKLPADINFKNLRSIDSLQMQWTDNLFIGHHWLFGDFKIELASDQQSIGKIENIININNKVQALNTNEFYFRFSFPRFNNLTILNKQPIINSSIVFDIPPTVDSVYRLNEDSKSIRAQLVNGKSFDLKFNYCDISLYPERNINTEIIDIKKVDKSYKVSVKYTNLTDEKITCAYFLVLHDKDLITTNDYGFKKINAGKSIVIEFLVSHKLDNVLVDLPIFGGVYLPITLRGAKKQIIQLQF